MVIVTINFVINGDWRATPWTLSCLNTWWSSRVQLFATRIRRRIQRNTFRTGRCSQLTITSRNVLETNIFQRCITLFSNFNRRRSFRNVFGKSMPNPPRGWLSPRLKVKSPVVRFVRESAYACIAYTYALAFGVYTDFQP